MGEATIMSEFVALSDVMVTAPSRIVDGLAGLGASRRGTGNRDTSEDMTLAMSSAFACLEGYTLIFALALGRRHVEGADQAFDLPYIMDGVGDDKGVRRGVCDQIAVLADERRKGARDVLGIDVCHANDPVTNPSPRMSPSGITLSPLCARGGRSNDPDDLPVFHRSETLDLEGREEHLSTPRPGDPGRRHERHLARDALVDDEILPRELAHHLDESGDFDVIEVQGDKILSRSVLLRSIWSEEAGPARSEPRSEKRKAPGNEQKPRQEQGREFFTINLQKIFDALEKGNMNRGIGGNGEPEKGGLLSQFSDAPRLRVADSFSCTTLSHNSASGAGGRA